MYNAALRSVGSAILLPPGIFVSATGSDAASGTNYTSPLRTIPYGLLRAAALGVTNVYVAEGVYSRGNGIASAGDGVIITGTYMHIAGGFTPLSYGWVRALGRSVLDGQLSDGMRVIFFSNAFSCGISGITIRGATNAGGAAVLIDGSRDCFLNNVVIEQSGPGAGTLITVSATSGNNRIDTVIAGISDATALASAIIQLAGGTNTLQGRIASNNIPNKHCIAFGTSHGNIVSAACIANNCNSVVMSSTGAPVLLRQAVVASNTANVIISMQNVASSGSAYGFLDSFITNNSPTSGTLILLQNFGASQPMFIISNTVIGDSSGAASWDVREWAVDFSDHTIVNNVFVTNNIVNNLYSEIGVNDITRADISPLNTPAHGFHNAVTAYGNSMRGR